LIDPSALKNTEVLILDIATLVGFLGGLGIIIGAIATGGDVMMFVDVPSVLIVVVGRFMVALM